MHLNFKTIIMKRQSLLWLSAILFALSCHSASSKKDTGSESTTSAPTEESSATAPSNPMASSDATQKRTEELKKLKPISNDELKSVFQDEVMGIKRSSFSVNSAMGYAVGNAEYRKDDTTKYTVGIYDCAGEAGSAFYAMQFFTALNMEREDDNGYEKTTTYMGSKALEKFQKGGNQHSLNFTVADRFWVSLEGENTGLDALKSFGEKLNLDKLKSIR
jgi:hypothetical protein